MPLSIVYADRPRVTADVVVRPEFAGDCGFTGLARAYADAFSRVSSAAPAIDVMVDAALGFAVSDHVAFEVAYAQARTWLVSHDAELALVVADRDVVKAPDDLVRIVGQCGYVQERRMKAAPAPAMPPTGSSGWAAPRASMPQRSAVPARSEERPAKGLFGRLFKSTKDKEEAVSEVAAVESAAADVPVDLQDRLAHLDASFSETLLLLIDARGFTDAEVYKRANISRQHFSKIRSDASYRPKKQTVLAFAVALELTYDEARMLLERAGFTFSSSAAFDVIVGYYLQRGICDVFEINKALFALDQPLLGSV